MGRPTKNANHPLVRLRKKLSTDADEVTRKDLAKRTGIPETSLRDIETGRYKITPEVAAKISYATGVDPRSLLAGDDPLLDFRGQPLSKNSPMWPVYHWWLQEVQEVREQLLAALLDTAEEKKIVLLIHFSFENWLSATIQAFGLDALFAKKLTDRLGSFDPNLVPYDFRPKNKQLEQEWTDFDYQILQEYGPILDQLKIDKAAFWKTLHGGGAWAERDVLAYRGTRYNPFVTLSPDASKAEYQQKLTEIHAQARERATQKRNEAQRKIQPVKPLSGKRSRSSGRPEA